MALGKALKFVPSASPSHLAMFYLNINCLKFVMNALKFVQKKHIIPIPCSEKLNEN